VIAKIYGTIDGFSHRGIYLRVGGLVYEVCLTAAERRAMEHYPIGEEISLHTLYFMEGGVGGGNHTPLLVGFQNPQHREFFELLIRVEGIGVGRALKMLTAPIPQIAQAIEENNLSFLCTLKQVGERTARKIVASLMGKVKLYAQPVIEPEIQSEGDTSETKPGRLPGDSGAMTANPINLTSPEQVQEQLRYQAAEVLEQLGYSNSEVKKMLNQVFEKRSDFTRVEEILAEIYRKQEKPIIK
jgi:Holliday junction DNA helicase RuvA